MNNFRTLATAMLLGVSALAIVAPANAAAPCRNAQGRFTKCAGGSVAMAPRRVATPTAAHRTAAAPARSVAATTAHAATPARSATPAMTHAAAPARTVALAKPAATKPAYAVVAARPAATTVHKTATAAHPAG